MTDDLRTGMARAICRTGRIETGQGTCSLFCMDQLGDPRKSGCWHVERVHGAIADAAIAHFTAHLESDAMVERGKAAMLPLVNEEMDPEMRDAWLTDLYRAVIAAQVAAMKGTGA